jgi:hypothetical protein
VSPYIPRTWPKLAQLSAQHVGQEVAFAGVLVWAAEVNTGRRLQLRVDTEVGVKAMQSFECQERASQVWVSVVVLQH